MINPIIKTNKYINQNPISVEKSLYKYMPSRTVNNVYFESKYVIDKIQFTKSGNDTDLEDKVIFHNYDEYANPIEVSKKDGTRISYIWGYNGMYPIAKIENAPYSSITPALITEAQYQSNNGFETTLLTALTNLRASLPDAMVTTYTYIPLVGVSTITDPRGHKITYTYDSFNRLQFVKDREGNILSENQYNYKP
jgi:YD repeat-containing protein